MYQKLLKKYGAVEKEDVSFDAQEPVVATELKKQEDKWNKLGSLCQTLESQDVEFRKVWKQVSKTLELE